MVIPRPVGPPHALGGELVKGFNFNLLVYNEHGGVAQGLRCFGIRETRVYKSDTSGDSQITVIRLSSKTSPEYLGEHP
jgi:hypothetical protein